MWSRELQTMLRPAATFADVADAPRPAGDLWLLWRRPLRLAFLFGAFLSFTTTGRLTLRLVFDGLIFWSFVPAMNVMPGLALARWAPVRLGAARTTDLLFSTFGPWLGWMLVVMGVSAVRPGTAAAPWSASVWLAPLSFAVALLWSGWIQYRLYRGAFGIRTVQAVLAVTVLKMMVWGVATLWFLVTDQLEPRVPQILEAFR